jgi:hypothetical protein
MTRDIPYLLALLSRACDSKKQTTASCSKLRIKILILNLEVPGFGSMADLALQGALQSSSL